MKKLFWTILVVLSFVCNPFPANDVTESIKTYHDEPKVIQWITDDDGTVYEIGWTWYY